jgi:hypothetical protein
MTDEPQMSTPTEASDLPDGWKPGDSAITLNDDVLVLPRELSPLRLVTLRSESTSSERGRGA